MVFFCVSSLLRKNPQYPYKKGAHDVLHTAGQREEPRPRVTEGGRGAGEGDLGVGEGPGGAYGVRVESHRGGRGAYINLNAGTHFNKFWAPLGIKRRA